MMEFLLSILWFYLYLKIFKKIRDHIWYQQSNQLKLFKPNTIKWKKIDKIGCFRKIFQRLWCHHSRSVLIVLQIYFFPLLHMIFSVTYYSTTGCYSHRRADLFVQSIPILLALPYELGSLSLGRVGDGQIECHVELCRGVGTLTEGDFVGRRGVCRLTMAGGRTCG